MSFGHAITLKDDLAGDGDHAASQAFAPVSMDDRASLRLTLNVTKAGGTSPTLDLTLQTSESASGPWRTLGTFTQATSVGSERKCFGPCDRYVRASAVIGGTTPALRFTIKGDSL